MPNQDKKKKQSSADTQPDPHSDPDSDSHCSDRACQSLPKTKRSNTKEQKDSSMQQQQEQEQEQEPKSSSSSSSSSWSEWLSPPEQLANLFEESGMGVSSFALRNLSNTMRSTLDTKTVFSGELAEELEKAASRLRLDANRVLMDYQSSFRPLGSRFRVSSTTAAKEWAAKAGFSYSFFSLEYQKRLWVVLLALAICAFINSLAATASGWRTPNIVVFDLQNNPIQGLEGKLLPDLGFDFVRDHFIHSPVPRLLGIPVISQSGIRNQHVDSAISEPFFDSDDGILVWDNGPDLAVQIFGYFALALTIFHPRRFIIVRRVFSVFCVLNLMRAILITVTSLPDPAPRCQRQFDDPQESAYKHEPMFSEALLTRAMMLFVNPATTPTCGDLILSGHTVWLLLLTLLMKEYAHTDLFYIRIQVDDSQAPQYSRPPVYLPPVVDKLVRWTAYMVLPLCLFIIIATHFHYTLDVLLACVFTYGVWEWYHSLLGVVALRRANFFLQWLESEEVLGFERDVFGQEVLPSRGAIQMLNRQRSTNHINGKKKA